MAEFLSQGWAERLYQAMAAQGELAVVGGLFDGDIQLECEGKVAHLRFATGAIQAVRLGTATAPTIRIGGTAEQWTRIRSGSLGFYEAFRNHHLQFTGDQVALMRHWKLVWQIGNLLVENGEAKPVALRGGPWGTEGLAQVTGHYVAVDGLVSYYESAGAGQPFIMLHGAAQDSLSWRENLLYFSQRYHAIAVDLPGHGKTFIPPSGPVRDSRQYADHVAGLIRALGLRDVIVAGHSMSGGVALYLGLKYPDLVKTIVVVDGAAETAKVMRKEAYALYGVNPLDMMETGFYELGAHRKQELAYEARHAAPPEVIYGDLTSYTSLNIAEHLGEIRQPTLFLQGAKDFSLTPAQSRATYDQMTCPKEYVLFDQLGHFPHFEDPAAFNRKLQELLTKWS